jgi:hypothetical protein
MIGWAIALMVEVVVEVVVEVMVERLGKVLVKLQRSGVAQRVEIPA